MVGIQQFGHIARRSLVAIRDQQFDDFPAPVRHVHQMQVDMPTWGVVLLGLTILSGVLLISSVRYTLYRVVATLAMVESPQTTVIVRQEKEKVDPDALAEDLIDSEVTVIKQKPLTSSIRSTVAYLKSRGGFQARWRGLSAIAVWGLGYAILKGVFTDLLAPLDAYHDYQLIMLGPALASIVSRVLMARLGLTWTHIVISEPSAKPWFRRIPSRKAWKQIFVPTLLTAVAWQCNFLIPAIAATALNLGEGLQTLDEDNAGCNALKTVAVGALAFTWFLGICIPAEVALTRVQASMLPEEDASIVSLDRSFGGAVEATSGKLGYVKAWQTFDRPARLNLLKLSAKIVMVDIALHMLVGLTVIMELVLIMGPQLEKVFAYRAPDKFPEQERFYSMEIVHAARA